METQVVAALTTLSTTTLPAIGAAAVGVFLVVKTFQYARRMF